MKKVLSALALFFGLSCGTALAQAGPTPVPSIVPFNNTIISSNLANDVSNAGSNTVTLVVTGPQTLTANVTVPANVTLIVNAGAIIASGSNTLTINGPFQAGRYQTFSGFSAGGVSFGTGAYVKDIYPEWWGAVANNATVSDAAMTDALGSMVANGGQDLNLNAGTYLLNTCALQVTKAGTGIVGTNFQNSGFNCTLASADVIDVLGTSGTYINGNFFRDFFVQHATAPSAGTNGIEFKYTTNVNAQRILSANSANGYYITGSNDLQADTLITNFTLVDAISYKGFYIDGTTANASIYIRSSSVGVGSVGLTLTSSYGLYHTGTNISDSHYHIETDFTQYGAYIVSSGGSGNDSDIHIDDPISDQFSVACIYISGVSQAGAVTIDGGWCNPTNTGTSLNTVDIENSSNISITGLQFQNINNLGFGRGLYLNAVTDSTFTGNTFTNFPYPIYLNASSNNTITGNTTSNASGDGATVGVDFLTSPLNAFVGNSIDGYGTTGVNLDSGSQTTTFSGNNVNPAHYTTPCAGVGSASTCYQTFSANVPVGSAVSLTTNTPANITSLSLAAGAWDVFGSVCYSDGSTTNRTYMLSWTNTTSATYPAAPLTVNDLNPSATPNAAVDNCYTLPTYRYLLTTTTTVYMSAQAGFTVSTSKAYGALFARRAN